MDNFENGYGTVDFLITNNTMFGKFARVSTHTSVQGNRFELSDVLYRVQLLNPLI